MSSLFSSWNRPHVGHSPILPPRSWAARARLTPTQSRPDLPVPPALLSQGKEPGPSGPLILQVQGHSQALWGACPPFPDLGQARIDGQVGRQAPCGQDLQPGQPGSWCSGGRHVESVPLYGQLSLIVIVCSLGAQQTLRGDTPSMRTARSPATRPIRTVN